MWPCLVEHKAIILFYEWLKVDKQVNCTVKWRVIVLPANVCCRHNRYLIE